MTPIEPPDDRDLKSLAALAPIEPPAELMGRVRRQAHRELEVAREGDWLARATRVWNLVGLPAALTVMVIGYLSWAVDSASALYR
jgi:hypothetical protein